MGGSVAEAHPQIPTRPKPIEDLKKQAHDAFQLSASLCGACRPYHAVYPYMRLAGRKRGVDADREVLEPLLARFVSEGARRILIAGSADPGVLALVLAAAAPHPVAITVVDLCPTPLAVCRTLAQRHGIRLETQAACVSQMELAREYDLLVAHSVLNFVATALHGAVLERFAKALAPGGSLVMTTTVSSNLPPVDAAALSSDVLAGLAAGGIELPVAEAEFRVLLAGYAAVQATRNSPASTAEELVGSLAQHRLEVTSVTPKARMVGYTASGTCVDHASPGVLVTARRR
jgi:hypothetical protein